MGLGYRILIAILTIFTIYNLLKMFGVFDFKVGKRKAEKNKRESFDKRRLRNFVNKKLSIYESMTRLFSFLFSIDSKEMHVYYINRLDIKSEVLNRLYTPEELRGKFILFLLIGVIFIPISLLYVPAIAVTISCVIVFLYYERVYSIRIKDEDEIIDNCFCDLFLLMYAQLRKGSRGDLTNVVKAYQTSLDNLGNSKTNKVMSSFTKFLLGNLSMYADHIAVMKLPERYMSATIVNFANLAAQSLQGVDNYDTLLSFRIDLINKKKDKMKRISEKTKIKMQFAIYSVYLILAQFAILSIVAKLPKSILQLFKGGM